MTYKPDVPQPYDKLQDNQPEFLTNFSKINTIFSVNHFSLTDNTDGGKHKFVTFLYQESDPNVLEDEIGLYTKKVSGERLNIVQRYQSNGQVIPVSPFLQAYVELGSTGNIIVYGNPINLNVDDSGWSGKSITITFENEAKDINYITEISKANTTNQSVFTLISKSEQSFSFSNTSSLTAGQRFYIRAY
ncbi:MAG: hypothetical protein PVF17_00680 [Ignavibacteria bacterium]|jgi:hypothetical protein